MGNDQIVNDQLATEIEQTNKQLRIMNEELKGIKVTLSAMLLLPLLIFIIMIIFN